MARRSPDLRHLRHHKRKLADGTHVRDGWVVRVAVPRDLRLLKHPAFLTRTGKGMTHVEVYLGTANRAEAVELKHSVIAEIRKRFKRAREGGTVRTEDLRAIRHREMAREYQRGTNEFLDRGRAYVSERLSHLLEWEYDEVDDRELEPNPGPQWRDRAERFLRDMGLEPSADNVDATAKALLSASVDALDDVLAGRRPPPLPDGVAPVLGGGKSPTISEASKAYVAERTRDPKARLTAQTAAQVRASIRLFGDYAGDARLDEVTRQTASAFLDALGKLHRHYGRRPDAARLPLSELLRRYPAGDGEGLSNKTLNRHLSALSKFYKWARKRGHVPADHVSPFSEQMRETKDSPWLPYTVAELNRLLDGLRYEVRPRRHSLASAMPWVLAVALFSGMRQGEICDLDAEDVKKESGVRYFDVTAAKSEAGVRRVPVHSALVDLGFLRYARAVGTGPLFPGIAPGGPDERRAHTFAKRFPAFRRQRGVSRARTAFHSLRKCFVRALELAKVDRDRAALVVGHERGFTFRVYNPEGVDMAMLREVVEAVGYEGLKMPTPKMTRAS